MDNSKNTNIDFNVRTNTRLNPRLQQGERRNNKNSSFIGEVKSLIYIIILALSIRILVFEPFYIPSDSMKKTLINGDYIFSTKYSYGYSRHSFIISTNLFSGRFLEAPPKRGDVIIFRPPHQMHERYIKRLVGLPGEKIEIKNSIIYINDIQVQTNIIRTYEENGVIFDEYKETLSNGVSYFTRHIRESEHASNLDHLYVSKNSGPFFIPEGHYFFLGDNRDQSGDSRFELGFVPFENFISKARFVFFSFGEPLILDNPLAFEQITQVWKWISSFKYQRFFLTSLYDTDRPKGS
ncbi:MAG: signal peptidase I [Rickettsiaceae bacterium]|nr:signal peptidase I [Rickettsiaceae bacterium]